MSEEIPIPTPFGQVELPKPKLPKLKPPEMDERRGKAMAHSVAIDISSIIGWIPIIGDIVADVVEDLHGAELRKLLTPAEMEKYVKEDKVAPSTIAMLRTFMEE
jgi:hypothetical protein